jgi:site-specific DNA-methyltransferase (adenine-specific)
MFVDIYNTENKYDVIYADPPWSYYNDMSVDVNCTTVKGMRRPPYSVLSSKDIANIPISNIAKDDCILFIWTTDYHLDKCIKVIESWGFKYKTIGFVWAKKNKQGKQVSFMGAYTKKSGCEICLLATKGKHAHKMVKNHKVSSFIEYPRAEHSKKPDIIRDSIIELLGEEPKKIELFARNNFDGWDCWGDDKNIISS